MTPAKSTLRKLRSLYTLQWQRDWPYDDHYLTILWLDACDQYSTRKARASTFLFCVDLMRECHEHEFTP